MARLPKYEAHAVSGATHPPPAVPFQTHPAKNELH